MVRALVGKLNVALVAFSSEHDGFAQLVERVIQNGQHEMALVWPAQA
jgi:hypothetical protein